MIASNNFLIPNFTLVIEVIAFVIVLAVFARYILPPINKALKERQERMRHDMEAAERAREEAAAIEEERRATLERARQQAREIVAQGNQIADQLRDEGHVRGQEEFERLVSAAQSEIGLARQRAVSEATEHLGEMVIGVVEAIIGREVDAEAHRDLIQDAIGAVSGEGASADGGRRAETGTRS